MLCWTKVIYNVLNRFSNLPQEIIHEPKDTSDSLYGMVFFSAVGGCTETKQGY